MDDRARELVSNFMATPSEPNCDLCDFDSFLCPHFQDLLVERISTYVAEVRAEALKQAAKIAEVCTCGSGPEFRSMRLRHHAALCSMHTATMIRALIKESSQGETPQPPNEA